MIRRAEFPSDLADVRALFEEYARWIGVDLTFQNFEQELATLPGRYAPPRGCVLLATVDGRPAGCVAMRPLESAGDCEMKRLFVADAFRGRGLGRELAEALLAEARRAGYRRLLLDTLAHMTSARALYRALGFAEVEPYCFNPLPGTMHMSVDL